MNYVQGAQAGDSPLTLNIVDEPLCDSKAHMWHIVLIMFTMLVLTLALFFLEEEDDCGGGMFTV